MKRFLCIASLFVALSAEAMSLDCPDNPDPDCRGKCGKCGQSVMIGDPVTANALNSYLYRADITLQTSLGPVEFVRTYNSADLTVLYEAGGVGLPSAAPAPFGVTTSGGMRWSHNFYSFVRKTVGAANPWYIRTPSGALRRFEACSPLPCWNEPYGANRSEPNRMRTTSTSVEFFTEIGERYVYESLYEVVQAPSPGLTYYLSSVHDSLGRLVATIKYGQPTPTGGGACPAPGGTGDAGVPYIRLIETVDSSALSFSYALATGISGTQCVVDRVDVQTNGGFSTVQSYGYVTAGKVASVARGGATFNEAYTYSTGDAGFAWGRGGTEYARHNYAGAVVASAQGEGPAMSISYDTATTCENCRPSWVPPQTCATPCGTNGSGCYFCCTNGKHIRVVDAGVQAGDGTMTTASLVTTYYLAVSASHHGQYTFRVDEGCNPETACSPGQTWYAVRALPDASTPYQCDQYNPGREMATGDKRGNWTVYPYDRFDAGSTAGVVWEQSALMLGATSSLGVSPLYSEKYQFGYGSDSIHRLERVTQASAVPGWGGSAETVIRYAGSSRQPNAYFRSGRTLTVTGAGVSKTQAVFISRDGAGRVTAIEGPCFLGMYEDYSAAACSTGAPYMTLEYWPTSEGSSNAGRLKTATRYPGGTGSSLGLATRYSDYTALGDPGRITDLNNNQTDTLAWQGRELRKFTPAGLVGDAGWTLGWDTGELASVQYPAGNFEVFCHRTGGSGGACGGAWTKQVQWRARSSNADGTNWSERVVYDFWPDESLKSEQRLVPGEAARLTRFFAQDGHGRATWHRVGLDAGGYLVKRHFDAANNQDALSLSLNEAAPDFCRDGTQKSLLCSWLEHDRANRLAVFDQYPAATEPGARTCVDYDPQSNIKRIAASCEARRSDFNGCALNSSTGGGSDCGTAADYQHDDFGNLVRSSLPALGDGGSADPGTVSYEYNALGRVVLKRVNAETTLYVHDALGRLTAIGPQGESPAFTLEYDSSPMNGCTADGGSIDAPGQMGRLAMVFDRLSWWQTMYTYDPNGRLLGEYRRNGTTGCPTRNTTYAYTTDGNGNLREVTYPHERAITYFYGSALGLNNRVERVDVNVWDGGSWGSRTLVSGVKWEPYGGLRGYHLHFVPPATYATLEYVLGDNSSTDPSGAGCDGTAPSIAGSSYDGTARLRSLRVTGTTSSTPTYQSGSGNIFKKTYTWKGDAVRRVDTCYPGMTTSLRENFSYDNALRLTQVTVPNFATTGGFQNGAAFTYDNRGNRLTWLVDNGSAQVDYVYAGGSTPDRLVFDKPHSGAVVAHRYDFDYAGRVSARSWGDYADNLPLLSQQTMQHHNAWTGGPDTALSEVTTAAGHYDYYYDIFGRRHRKVYPNFDADTFVYSAFGRELFEDVGVTSSGNTSSFPIDDYVWLGGRPIAQLRGQLNASHARSGAADHSGVTCQRMGLIRFRRHQTRGGYGVADDRGVDEEGEAQAA